MQTLCNIAAAAANSNSGTVLYIVIAVVIAAAVSGFISFRAGVSYRKSQAESAIGSAEKEAERIIESAKEEADSKKKIALVEAKDEIHKSRTELEKEIKERGGSIILNSDSHRATDLTCAFDESLELLRANGFGSIIRLVGGNFEELGI